MALDLTRYLEAKEKKAAMLQKLGPTNYQVIVTKYDQLSKEQVDSDVEQMNRISVEASIKAIDTQIANMNKAKAGLQQILKDMDTLDAAAKPT